MTNNTRKQHYVWEYYLTAWATRGRVWCQRGGTRFCTSTENIAHRRDFYRLREMRERDLEFVKMLIIDKISPELRILAMGWIPHFTEVFRLQKLYRESGNQNSELERELDTAINNIEELIHSEVEGSAVPILDSLRQGDVTVLADPDLYVDFSLFMAMQYMRTPSIMGRVARAATGFPQLDFNIDAAWGLMRTIYATNMGSVFYRLRNSTRLTILNAPSAVEFITGDQPIINLRAIGGDDTTPPTELELYYPLTPTRALLMDFGHPQARVERRALSAEEVRDYNHKLTRVGEGQLYAASKLALESLQEP